jgi:hypothetical protein
MAASYNLAQQSAPRALKGKSSKGRKYCSENPNNHQDGWIQSD